MTGECVDRKGERKKQVIERERRKKQGDKKETSDRERERRKKQGDKKETK